MTQVKVSVDEKQSDFLDKYESYGFKDKSSLVQEAIEHFRKEIEIRRLRESADLYSEVYSGDSELKGMTDSAISEWPE